MKEIIHDADKLAGPGFYKLAGGTFFSHRQTKKGKKKSTAFFVIEATSYWKGKKNPAFMLLTLLGMPFILTFNKAAGCPSPT